MCAVMPGHGQKDESIWFLEDRLAIENFKKNVENPDIVFMGSSMIRTAMWCADHDADKTSAGYSHYYKAEDFEKKMAETGSVRKAYDLAADGAYASDLFLMFDKLLTGSKQPKLVVCVISPREFVGAWFVSARATPIYKLLAEPSDFLKTGFLYSSDFTDWIEGVFRFTVPLYRNADSYKAQLSGELQGVPLPNGEGNSMTMADAGTLSANTKSLQAKRKIFENQIQCIHELVKTAKQRQIKVVFVNLPLREDAKGIYTPIAADYQKFLDTLSQSVPVLNLELEPSLSKKELFVDPWHCNQKGSERLIEEFVKFLHVQPAKS